MKLSTPPPLLIVALVLSSANSAPAGMSPSAVVVDDNLSSSFAASDSTGGVNDAAAAASSSGGRSLQQSSVNCDITAAYHPDYTLGWNLGHCVLTTTCNSPSYATELECCQEAYAGQESKTCVSNLDNPPTMSPTITGGPSEYYADYTLPWPEGVCINTVPVPSGRPVYTSQLACCKAAYGGQVSKACINDLPSPPTSSPTELEAADYYADYSLAWPEGKCINTHPVPSGRPIYTSQLACCKAAYGGQVSKVCINDLPSPPTSSPTILGADEYYPNYSLAWPEGVCIKTQPVPSGRPTYTSQLGCCQAAYAGQVSRACILAATATASP